MSDKGKKEIKTVNQWLDDNSIENGQTMANIHYKHEYERIRIELRRMSSLLYFLVTDLGIHSMAKLMYSAKNQGDYCYSVIIELKYKKVEKEHIPVFSKNREALDERLRWIRKIVRENLHLTEYEPFFLSEVWANLNDIDFKDIKGMADKWNDENKDIVEAHMKEVQPEIDRHKQYVIRAAKKIDAEKAAAKLAKKEEDAYVREMKKNREKNRAEYRRLERTFESHYKGG